MRSLVKTSFISSLFLIPLWFVCSRPVSIQSELVPLPFRIQESSKPSLSLEDLKKQQVILTDPARETLSDSEMLLINEVAPDAQRKKKITINYEALKVQQRDAVRLKGARVGIDYHVNDHQSVGIESSQQIYDRQDAKAGGKRGQDESTAGIKYKLIF